MKYGFLNDNEEAALKKWHVLLDTNRGDRARLRRTDNAEDVLLTRAFFNFLDEMPECWRENKPMLVSAAVAGVLSHVKRNKIIPSEIHESKSEDAPKKIMSFAEQLATPLKNKKAPMSELRFQQLQKSRTENDFYRLTLRAVNLLGSEVNIFSLANDIIQWHQEFYQKGSDRKSTDRLAVRWATDYFSALSKHTKKEYSK